MWARHNALVLVWSVDDDDVADDAAAADDDNDDGSAPLFSA